MPDYHFFNANKVQIECTFQLSSYKEIGTIKTLSKQENIAMKKIDTYIKYMYTFIKKLSCKRVFVVL